MTKQQIVDFLKEKVKSYEGEHIVVIPTVNMVIEDLETEIKDEELRDEALRLTIHND